jgi:hypothetical protein
VNSAVSAGYLQEQHLTALQKTGQEWQCEILHKYTYLFSLCRKCNKDICLLQVTTNSAKRLSIGNTQKKLYKAHLSIEHYQLVYSLPLQYNYRKSGTISIRTMLARTLDRNHGHKCTCTNIHYPCADQVTEQQSEDPTAYHYNATIGNPVLSVSKPC